MGNNKAAEFLSKVLSDEELKAQLADKTPAQAAELAAELGYEITEEELVAAEKELRKQNSPEVVELDLEDMDKAAGGSRDWSTQGCAATVEAGSSCWGTDYCVFAYVTYTHSPSSFKCPNCGSMMYLDKTTSKHKVATAHYKCPKCGTEMTRGTNIGHL
ncbi:MAG: Nif11-like leader peptide family RiPP precursor [Ruminococcus sp.]|nr:Nif11-like leader peptide family RiPP precursor [Ruminococcus sp.]